MPQENIFVVEASFMVPITAGIMRVPYTFFVTCEWAFLLCVKREWGFIFSVICESIYLSYLGKLVFDFFVFHEICIYFCVIFELMTFAGIMFYFFDDFRVLKARKLHQTRCKTCPFDELADGGVRTNHSDTNLEGLESAIMDKSPWTLYSSRPPSGRCRLWILRQLKEGLCASETAVAVAKSNDTWGSEPP